MKIFTLKEAVRRVESWKLAGDKVVFTNGCFDILHRGHVEYLSEAKEFGGKLIIGLNSDVSVQRLKGQDRPIQSQEDRAVVLDALSVVDGIVIFYEDTPLELVKQLKPDVLLKGGDYKAGIDSIVGADEVKSWGGAVHVVNYYKKFSTSNLISKIQSEIKS